MRTEAAAPIAVPVPPGPPIRDPARPADARSNGRSLVGGLTMLATAAVIHGVVLYGHGTPPGIDTGNWLAFGRDLLGAGLKPPGVAYPPVVPLLVLVSVSALGPVMGLAIVGGIAAVAPAAAVFLVLRWARLGWWAVAIAAALSFAPGIGEIASWGGYPQLLAAPATVTLVWWLDRWLVTGRRRALIAAVAGAVMVLATSHLVALVAVAVVAIAIAVRVAATPSRGRGPELRRAAVALGASAIVASPLVAVYVRLVPALAATQGSAGRDATLSSLPVRSVQIHGGPVSVVLALAVLAGVVALVAARPFERDTLWVVSAALIGGVLASVVWTSEPRILYEAPVAAGVGAGAFVGHVLRAPSGPRWAIPVAAVGVAAALLVMSVSGLAIARRQRSDYAVASEAIVDALGWIKASTPRGSIVVAPDLDGAPLGWWIEGLGQRRAIAASPRRWLVFPQEQADAAQGRALLAALERDLRDGLEQAERLGVDYLFVPTATPTYEMLLVDIEAGRLVPVFRNAGVAIFATSTPEGMS